MPKARTVGMEAAITGNFLPRMNVQFNFVVSIVTVIRLRMLAKQSAGHLSAEQIEVWWATVPEPG